MSVGAWALYRALDRPRKSCVPQCRTGNRRHCTRQSLAQRLRHGLYAPLMRTSRLRSAIDWPCFSTPEHVECEQTQQWVREHGELQLCESTLTFENKIVSLRDDHGKDILEEHATTLCHNKYVEGVLCSLPFKPKHRSYIYRIYDDGAIDIVLYWDDRGLSMRIKTTGRNIQETTAIAYILREQYGR